MDNSRSEGELLVKLSIQRRALTSSCEAYDRGDTWEAERLAVTAYVLLHDGGPRTRSLLGQLGMKSSLKYISSSRGFRMEFAIPLSPSPLEVSPPAPLIHVRMGDEGILFSPDCEITGNEEWHRILPFSKWYEEPIFKTANGRALSRKNLIFSLRSQDGGAHIDALLRDEAYVSLKSDPDSRMRSDNKPVPNAHYASMRQISWEICQSLADISD